MILRKPYAILIKHFKLIHVIFTLISLFLFLKCNDLLEFIEEYIANSGFILADYRIEELLPFYVNFLIFIGVVLNIIIMVLLKNKNKKITFYIINVFIYLALLIGFIYTSSILTTMQNQIVDTRIVRALRDIFNALSVIELISLVMYAFRATGFDIRKFNFTKDLVDLQIEDKDNEEVEVAVDFDFNQIDRKRRKNIRLLKYFYFENKFWCNIAFVSVGLIVLLMFFISSNVKEPTFNQYQLINTSNYSFKIEDVYITKKDKNNNVISDGKSFVIVEVKVKKNNNKQERFNASRLELQTDEMNYHHNERYMNYFEDIGTIYTNQELSKEEKNYFLVYRVNDEDINNMSLVYFNNNKDVIINFNSINLDKINSEAISLKETKKIENSILDDYEFTIDKFELADKIKINYRYCLNSNNCITSKEYIVPSISTNYDKAILRIDGTLTIPNDYNSYIGNMEMFLTRFGYLKYTINNNVYTSKFLGTLSSKKVKQDNTVYLEVKEEVLNANKVVLVLKIRNQIFELTLKEGEV